MGIALLSASASVFAQGGALQMSHFPSDAAAISSVQSAGGAFRFTGEAKIGRPGTKDWELAFRRHPLVLDDGTLTTAQFDSWVKDAPVSFRLVYDMATHRATLTLTRGAATGTVTTKATHDLVGDFSELFVRARAKKGRSRIVVQDLVLDGVAIADRASASVESDDDRDPAKRDDDDDEGGVVDVLRIRGGRLADGFVLTGTITMSWRKSTPKKSQLDAQFWAAMVPGGPPADATPPTVSITSPAEGSFLADARPVLTATYSDAGSGVDAASVRLTVDGVDRTAEAQVAASGLSWTPAEPLAEGAHSATVTVKDRAANPGQATRSYTTDTAAPLLVITAPLSGRTVAEVAPAITLQYEDAEPGSALDLSTFVVLVDGTNVTSSCATGPADATCSVPSLASGQHAIQAQISDRAHNAAQHSRGFELIRDATPPVVAITAPAPASFVRTPTALISGTVSDDSGLPPSVAVNGQEVAVANGQFSGYVELTEGPNELTAVATDIAGRQASATSTVRVDSQPPLLSITAPATGERTNGGSARVAGEASDENGVVSLEVGGVSVPLAAGRYERDVPLAEGANRVEVRALDAAGNAGIASVQIERFSLPQVAIFAPLDLSYLAATTIEVRGTLSATGFGVVVNGIPAVVTGTSFVAADVPLIEGGNLLTAVATDSAGRAGSNTVNVVRDLTAPHLSIDYPRPEVTLFDPTVRVAGLVNDIVAGTVNSRDVTVTVNDRPAVVSNRSFSVEGLPLAVGDNTITVVATDESGNAGRTSLLVRREEANVARVRVVAGDGQTAVIGAPLLQPLVVELTDAAGLPAAGKTVLFKVLRSDGSLGGGQRQLALVTAPDGRAQVNLTLGTRAGVGHQLVEAIAGGFIGPAVFAASALAGDPSLIVVDAGDQQLGIAGQPLPRPLVAVVTDSGANRLVDIAVRFHVVQGGGHFGGGADSITVQTDDDGRAIASFTLDSAEGVGNNTVEAAILGLPNSPLAGFVATGLGAGEAAATAISGVVLDNSNNPVPGVTLRILDTPLTAQADARGLFRIAGAPVGTLRMVVDGSTATRPGSWPDLEFVVTTVPGRDNTLGMPIYLLPLDLAHGVLVDETRGGTLTLPQVPGFALDIQPGSVTFPGGSKSGVVSVTVVHSDKVPMVPNFGQQPRLIVTIQPAGARFDPPARLTLPNVEGFVPGKVTEFYSFDHDLGHFVSIGPATVSEDGTTIVSNPGVGIVKAGWHCGGTPGGSGTAHQCPECQKCVNNNCQPDDGKPCDDKDDCTINDKCMGGTCKGEMVQVRKINGQCVAPVNQALSLTVDSNGPDKVKWQAPSGNPASGMGGSFSVTYSTEGDFTVTAMCKASSQTKMVSTGPDCSTITPRLNEVETNQAPDPGNWAQVHRIAHSAKYKGCANGGKWCFRLEEFKEEHGIGSSVGGAKDVTGANDSDVTPTTCAAIITEFTPIPAGGVQGVPGAPYSTYVPLSIVLNHERFHVNDFRAKVVTPTMNQLATHVSQASNCTDCKSATPDGRFNTEMERLWNANRPTYFDGMHEARAYTQENADLAVLVAAIKQRARAAPASEGWPAACK